MKQLQLCICMVIVKNASKSKRKCGCGPSTIIPTMPFSLMEWSIVFQAPGYEKLLKMLY